MINQLEVPYSIHTSRLILRCYTTGDGQDLRELIVSSLEHLKVRMSRAEQEPETLEQKVVRILKYRSEFLERSNFAYGIFDKET